jgi:hypothetical protein
MTLTTAVLAAAFGLFAGRPSTGAPADDVHGTASLGGQKATLTHGFGVWNADKSTASIGFFAKEPSAADQAAALKDDFPSAFGMLEPAKGPYVVVKLSFPKGSKHAEGLGMCEVDFFNFAASPLQSVWLGAADCGFTELGGDVQPGGVVHGKLKGPKEPDVKKAPGWDLAFTTTLRAPH